MPRVKDEIKIEDHEPQDKHQDQEVHKRQGVYESVRRRGRDCNITTTEKCCKRQKKVHAYLGRLVPEDDTL